MNTSFEDPEHWLKRAKEARECADMMRDNQSREAMLRIAKEYETMARRKQRNDAARTRRKDT